MSHEHVLDIFNQEVETALEGIFSGSIAAKIIMRATEQLEEEIKRYNSVTIPLHDLPRLNAALITAFEEIRTDPIQQSQVLSSVEAVMRHHIRLVSIIMNQESS